MLPVAVLLLRLDGVCVCTNRDTNFAQLAWYNVDANMNVSAHRENISIILHYTNATIRPTDWFLVFL